MRWGIAALVLAIMALVLVLPRWPVRSEAGTIHTPLTTSPEGNVWMEYLGRCIFHAAIFLVATLGLAVLIPLAANLFR